MKQGSSAALAVAIVGTFLIVAGLVGVMRRHTQAPLVDAARIAERSKALAELREAEAVALSTPAWIDQAKGLVRLPITNAMDLVLRAWENPAAARSNLIARVEKATAAPPKAPEKPSEFE
ncbi:MAG TPA: hypothetical protein P5038_11640 [Candidatus Paceibacterota bacterium]|nr:hypothetical protein [Candidatus Paceibacterota bacterium]HRT57270.1 hypothetical protein [Candidatus Paceibacterota bacterium]